jgi:hypothetical protein
MAPMNKEIALPSPNVINAVVGITWVSGLLTAWWLADAHPYLAFASLFFSFTARLRLPTPSPKAS